MLNRLDVLKFANNGNPPPDKRVGENTGRVEVAADAGAVQYYRLKGTERAFSSRTLLLFRTRKICLCLLWYELFDAETKYQSGTGSAVIHSADKGERNCLPQGQLLWHAAHRGAM